MSRSSGKLASHRRDPARSLAWQCLAEWMDGRRPRVIEEDFGRVGDDGRDTALARELALGAVRWQRLYDALSDRFLRPGNQPKPLRIALRLLCHQLLVCDRIPPHAALHATIEVAKQNGAGHLSGLINAVGRRLAALVTAERHGDGPLGRLASEQWPRSAGERHSLPDILVRDLAMVMPGDQDDALAALNRTPPLCTRTRPGMTIPDHPAMIRRDGPWTWWEDPTIPLRGVVADGVCVVQDRSQGEVIDAARPRPGDRVLDLCAAPGGKSVAFAERGCWVVAGDVQPKKMPKLAENTRGAARLVTHDGLRPPYADGAFDLVVVDAPCSNTGVLGRRPEARWRYQQNQLVELEAMQRGLITTAATLVAIGGRLIYSTCSVSPRENQHIAQALPGWRVLAERLSWPDAWQAGGYVAVLVRM